MEKCFELTQKTHQKGPFIRVIMKHSSVYLWFSTRDQKISYNPQVKYRRLNLKKNPTKMQKFESQQSISAHPIESVSSIRQQQKPTFHLKKSGEITYIIVIVAVVRSRGGTEASRLEDSTAFGSPPPDSPRTWEIRRRRRRWWRRRRRTTRQLTPTGSHSSQPRPILTPWKMRKRQRLEQLRSRRSP